MRQSHPVDLAQRRRLRWAKELREAESELREESMRQSHHLVRPDLHLIAGGGEATGSPNRLTARLSAVAFEPSEKKERPIP
jgi:hypothetical protein